MTGQDYDILYGIHSGLPVCCIKFYLTDWRSENSRNTPYAQAVHKSLFNYIPCPECFAFNRRIYLKQCDTDCNNACYHDFSKREATAEDKQLLLCAQYQMGTL